MGLTDTTSVWDVLAGEAADESPLWGASLRPAAERDHVPVFSPLLPAADLALGVETIYEGYLVHYGRPRLFSPPDDHTALLLGDYLYAHGLVRVAAAGDVQAINDLADLISICAQLRADPTQGDTTAADASVWAATVAFLGQGSSGLEHARAALRDGGDATALDVLARSVGGGEAVDRAIAAHLARVR